MWCCSKNVSVTMEQWSKKQRAFAVKAFYQSGSYAAAKRRFRTHFQIDSNRPAPSVNSIKLWVDNFEEIGETTKSRGGSVRSVRTPVNVERVRIAVKSSPQRSARRQSADLGISERSVQRILRLDLRHHPESAHKPNMNDLADKITSGISCTICKNISLYSVNQLVECQECHLIYHQECHKPPVSKADITDPRRVWYCAKCTCNMRKQPNNNTAAECNSSSPSGGSGSSGNRAPSTKSSSTLSASLYDSSPSNSSDLGGDRSSANTSSSSRDLKSSAGAGGSTTSSSMLSRSDGGCGKLSSSVPTTAPSNSMLSAEKRMQMMKKKAAAKMAERRKM